MNKKILLVTNIFPPHIGGPATFIDQLAHRLTTEGFKVTVICSSDGPSHVSDRDRPFRVIRVNILKREIYEILVRLHLFWQFLMHRAIIVNGLESYVEQIARFVKRKYIVKVVGDTVWETARNRGATVLNIDDFQVDAQEQKNWSAMVNQRNAWLRRAHLIVTPSHYLKSVVTRWMQSGQGIRVVFNGMNPEKFPKPTLQRRASPTLEVLFVGRLTNWKGVETALLAVQKIENVHLTVAGDGPEYPQLLTLAQQLKLGAKVTFKGRLSGAEVKKLLPQSHVLVLTSLYEGMSHTLIEALYSGLPCIASDCGGNSEVIDEGKTGYLIPPQDVDALANALVKLRDNEELRFQMAERCLQESTRFDLRKTMDEFVKLAQEL